VAQDRKKNNRSIAGAILGGILGGIVGGLLASSL
jgi:outer membrane lipoprotein SlyB